MKREHANTRLWIKTLYSKGLIFVHYLQLSASLKDNFIDRKFLENIIIEDLLQQHQ